MSGNFRITPVSPYKTMDILALLRALPQRAQVLTMRYDGRVRWYKRRWMTQVCAAHDAVQTRLLDIIPKYRSQYRLCMLFMKTLKVMLAYHSHQKLQNEMVEMYNIMADLGLFGSKIRKYLFPEFNFVRNTFNYIRYSDSYCVTTVNYAFCFERELAQTKQMLARRDEEP